MERKSFLASGHLPTLVSAFLYFDVSFMVWILFGPMTPFIAEQIHLSATQKGLLTAIPLLGGSFFRPILALLADRVGGRRAGLIGLCLTLVPADSWMAFRHDPMAVLSHRIYVGDRRRKLCRRASSGRPLVPCRASGTGHGHCRRRQLRDSDHHLFWTAPGAAFRLALCLRLGAHSRCAGACDLFLRGQKQPYHVRAESMEQICATARPRRYLEALLPLQPYLWWISRPRQFSHRVFS